MLKIARIAIKKNAAFSDCIVVFGVKPYIVAKIIYLCNSNVVDMNNVRIENATVNSVASLFKVIYQSLQVLLEISYSKH